MSDEKKTIRVVMISSTARDLPEHRKEVMDACLRQGKFPKMMEHMPASDDEAISASLKLVDEADIYVGVFAHRYGYVPKTNNTQQISITEMEYDHAVERKISRLIFVMGEDHLIKAKDKETENAAKLEVFKARVGQENIISFFNSPADPPSPRNPIVERAAQRRRSRERRETNAQSSSTQPHPRSAETLHRPSLLAAANERGCRSTRRAEPADRLGDD